MNNESEEKKETSTKETSRNEVNPTVEYIVEALRPIVWIIVLLGLFFIFNSDAEASESGGTLGTKSICILPHVAQDGLLEAGFLPALKDDSTIVNIDGVDMKITMEMWVTKDVGSWAIIYILSDGAYWCLEAKGGNLIYLDPLFYGESI